MFVLVGLNACSYDISDTVLSQVTMGYLAKDGSLS